ncbi:N-acetyltransferase [Streptomyces sp. 549]|uniref:GNAT family N-acetyltransferase n=1 Tax=Streptomyces sp. 549 TaxID=3049076 RepID=UPI0024C41ECE|nr:N-acetyltransferase [Streptomyces sp. 549]MDK1475754.1 N-acetyltransferase [Streptomyces sp. 549]
MLIRTETPADLNAVREVTTAAFANTEVPEPVETTLLDALRDCPDWLPALSLVAIDPQDGGRPVGHVVCTRGRVAGQPALGLGPLSVHPDHQGRGVGQALMHAVLGAADALGEPLVALLGSPAYYGRFGFQPSTEHGVTAPDPTWVDFFQVRTLTAHRPTLTGEFRYAAPFENL